MSSAAVLLDCAVNFLLTHLHTRNINGIPTTMLEYGALKSAALDIALNPALD